MPPAAGRAEGGPVPDAGGGAAVVTGLPSAVLATAEDAEDGGEDDEDDDVDTTSLAWRAWSSCARGRRERDDTQIDPQQASIYVRLKFRGLQDYTMVVKQCDCHKEKAGCIAKHYRSPR